MVGATGLAPVKPEGGCFTDSWHSYSHHAPIKVSNRRPVLAGGMNDHPHGYQYHWVQSPGNLVSVELTYFLPVQMERRVVFATTLGSLENCCLATRPPTRKSWIHRAR